ncbi:MAG TPA: glycoside hydrolase family 15 protein [Stellaceae bacterium]|nr:glycoside hydrolase family 15 protein [Stellaceae bacterium]
MSGRATQPLDLALIGNCRIAALIDPSGRIVWWCFPRFDANPVFCRLLSGDEGKGFCDVVLAEFAHAEARYLRNTAIVETELTDRHGGRVRITDFAPRFFRYERMFRPPQLVRRIVPLSGLPRISIRIRPTYAYGRPPTDVTMGSNHIRYHGPAQMLRVTTDAPLSYIAEETTFALTRPLSLILGPDDPFESAIGATAQEFEDHTRDFWLKWVRSLAIPFEWQDAVIRAAITLELCSFDETGGIVAAHTTSIPEAANSGRNWDYRYCWLRDAYFVVLTLNRLGATDTMQAYLNYITTIAAPRSTRLSPVHSLVPGEDLRERTAPDLAGFLGQGPVRIGNAAAQQDQHDAYGSVILAVSQMFIDKRLPHMGDEALFRRLEPLGEHARRLAFRPDAGIWEYRGRERVHTYSAALCWAACDRLAKIAAHLGIDGRAGYWREHALALQETILRRAWNEEEGAIAGTLDDHALDASVLFLAELGLIRAKDPRFVATCETIGRELCRNGRIMRYTHEDDFGLPETAFLVCNFWYIDALAAIGRKDEACELLNGLLQRRNAFGLFSEDIHPETGQLWGNIPQTYSMAAIINSAMRLSVKWEDVWCRD